MAKNTRAPLSQADRIARLKAELAEAEAKQEARNRVRLLRLQEVVDAATANLNKAQARLDAAIADLEEAGGFYGDEEDIADEG